MNNQATMHSGTGATGAPVPATAVTGPMPESIRTWRPANKDRYRRWKRGTGGIAAVARISFGL